MQFFNHQPQQLQPPAAGPAPQPGPAPVQYQDPRSQLLAQAMAAMGKQSQGSATGLGLNLLADAIDQHSLQQRQQQLQGQANGATPVGQAVSAIANGTYGQTPGQS